MKRKKQGCKKGRKTCRVDNRSVMAMAVWLTLQCDVSSVGHHRTWCSIINSAMVQTQSSAQPKLTPSISGNITLHLHANISRLYPKQPFTTASKSRDYTLTESPTFGHISPLAVIWVTNQDRLTFRLFSTLPCRRMKRKRACP